MNRGGRVVNSYYTFQGEGSHTAGGATEDTWRMTSLTDEQMRAAAATVTIPTTGTNAASLTDALNKGATLYNDGGDGIAHHGTLPYGVRAKAWAKGSYPYPVLVDSPLCDVNPDDYARTIVLEDPDLTIFLPPRSASNGKMVILLPGGGYHYLSDASGQEGEGWAPYYNDLGYACAVLRYTLPGGHPELPLTDLENAILYIRDQSATLHVNTVGVHGFSAGGHLASTAATHFTGAAKPDFQILFEPVITMGANAHTNSRNNFLGTSPTAEMVTLYSNELQVTTATPKAFIWYYESDSVVNPTYNGAAYYDALTAKSVPVTRMTAAGTTHGFPSSIKNSDSAFTTWLKAL